jgi:diguanylate cyclase (GGDEF)-like protein
VDGDDARTRRQRLRLRRSAVALGGCAAFAGLVGVALDAGLVAMSMSAFVVFSSLWLGGGAAFLVLVATGLNERFRDPALTVPQVVWAALGPIFMYPFVPEIPEVCLVGLMVIALFGSFRLRNVAYVATNGALLVGLGLAFLVRRWVWGDALDPGAELAGVLAFAIAFAVLTVVGFEVHGFRRELNRRNDALTLAFDRLRDAAIRDELTGIHNRRYLMEILEQQKAEADRIPEHGFVLCFLDLDHFKRVNDVFGHATGDEVLRRFAQIAHASVRDVDHVARLGGEEFVLVLVGTDQQKAWVVLERIRRQLASFAVSDLIPDFRITVSCGVTEYADGEDVEETMSRADSALYRAKHSGRDQIVIATEEDRRSRGTPVASATTDGGSA